MKKVYFASGVSIVCAICFCFLVLGGASPSQEAVVSSSTLQPSISQASLNENLDNVSSPQLAENDIDAQKEKIHVDFNPDPEKEKELPSYDPQSVVVKLMEGFNVESLRNAIGNNSEFAGMGVVEEGDDYAQLNVPSNMDVASALEKLNDVGIVQYAQPNYYYYTTGEAGESLELSSNYNNETLRFSLEAGSISSESLLPQSSYSPNDPLYKNDMQWGLKAVKAQAAWDEALQSSSLKPCTIAVLDSGFRYTHEDLKKNVVNTYDAATQGEMQLVNMVHGSGVAGVAGAVTDNGKGIASISANNCNLMLVKIADNFGAITSVTLKRALDYVYENATKYNVKVINMSLGQGSSTPVTSTSTDPALYNTISKLKDEKGVLTVVAACNRIYNESRTEVLFEPPFYAWPSDFDNVVSVINLALSSNKDGVVRSDSSNYNVDGQKAKNISAPGADITTVGYNSDNSYVAQSGTSFASPLVSGIAGLMFAANPNLTAYDVESYLYSTAKDLTAESGYSTGWDKYTGHGLVNAQAALTAAVNDKKGKKDISKMKVTASSVTYTGKALSPTIKVYDGKTLLKSGKDYSVSFKNNINAGSGTYIITGKGSYTGTKTGKFTINKRSLKTVTIKKKSIVYNGKSQSTNVKAVYDDRSNVVNSKNYTVTYYRANKATKNLKNVGPIVVKITGKGNYKGAVKKTFTITPKGTKITGFARGNDKIKVKWAKCSAQTDGFQVRVSKDPNFYHGVKTYSFKNGKRTSAIVENLSPKSSYYFMIRSYKKVNGKTYVSSWSMVKGTKTK